MRSLDRAVRLIIYFAGLAFVSIYCELIGRIWCLALTSKRSPIRVRRSNALMRHGSVVLMRLTETILNTRLEIRGHIPEGRFLVVSNHHSPADIAVLSSALSKLNLKFVAKTQLGRGIPTVSMALRHFGSALVSRPAARQDLKRLEDTAADLSFWEGSIVVFPEGTRSRDGRTQPYKRGAVRVLAERAGLPILPIAIDGTQAAFHLRDLAKLIDNGHGVVTIGLPIPREDWEGRLDVVLGEVRAWVSNTIVSKQLTRVDSDAGQTGSHVSTLGA
jgi:1-acyl-sn-glycerol-3-phosphate acyltransferase